MGPAALAALRNWAVGAPVSPLFSEWWHRANLVCSAGRGVVVQIQPSVMKMSGASCLQVGIALRSLSRGYLPDKAFIVVSLAVTAVFLIGWRSGLAAATPQVCSSSKYIC